MSEFMYRPWPTIPLRLIKAVCNLIYHPLLIVLECLPLREQKERRTGWGEGPDVGEGMIGEEGQETAVGV